MVRLDDRTAGVAILVGYLLTIGLLYRDPAAGLERATANIASTVYFVVLPAFGLLAAGTAISGGSYAGILLFPAASYLGIVGITLALGRIAPAVVVLIGGLVFGLSVVGVVVSLRSLVAVLGIDIGP